MFEMGYKRTMIMTIEKNPARYAQNPEVVTEGLGNGTPPTIANVKFSELLQNPVLLHVPDAIKLLSVLVT